MLVAEEAVAGPLRRAGQDLGRAGLGGEGLQASVDGRKARMAGADHPRIDHQGGLEGLGAVAGQVADAVLGVHEHVGADLELGEHAQFGVDDVGAGARAGDDRRRQILGAQPLDDAGQIGRALNDRLAPGLEALDVLVGAAIALHAGEPQAGRRGDQTGQGHRIVGRGDARAVKARIDIHHHLERAPAKGLRRHAQGADIGGIVGDHHQVADVVVQPDQPLDRRRADHRRGDQQGLDAPSGQGLGLAQLGAAGSDSALGDLAPGDLDALVGLGVGSKRDAPFGGEGGHGGDIAVQRIQIDHQDRGVQRRARTLLADQMLVEFEVMHGAGSALSRLRDIPIPHAIGQFRGNRNRSLYATRSSAPASFTDWAQSHAPSASSWASRLGSITLHW